MTTNAPTPNVPADKAAKARQAAAAATALATTPKPAGNAPKPPKRLSQRAAVQAAAEAGKLPVPPDFKADTHKRFRGKLDELVALAETGDVAGLKAFPINPVSTSPKALDRYRNLCVTALEAKAAKAE